MPVAAIKAAFTAARCAPMAANVRKLGPACVGFEIYRRADHRCCCDLAAKGPMYIAHSGTTCRSLFAFVPVLGIRLLWKICSTQLLAWVFLFAREQVAG